MRGRTYYFYFYYLNGSGRPLEMTHAWRRWGTFPRKTHLLALRNAKQRRGSAFVRLETCYKDDQGILRCYLTDVRCVDKGATSQPDQGTRT